MSKPIQVPITMSLDQRFDSRFRQTDHCWLWEGAVRGDGYGAFTLPKSASGRAEWVPDNRQVGAHRYALARSLGRWVDGQVLHTCDVPLCVRPDHLYEGTHDDNMKDKVERGRVPKLEHHGRARLTAQDVRDLRSGKITPMELSALRGVTPETCYHARSGRNWKDLDDV